MEKIRALVKEDGKAAIVSSGKPRTSLERLFLDATEAMDTSEKS